MLVTDLIVWNSLQHPLTGCWNWVAARNDEGYGYTRFRGRVVRAIRLSYAAFNDLDLDDMTPTDIVCHTCDNPRCVNPAHLVLSDQSENMRHRTERRGLRRGRAGRFA